MKTILTGERCWDCDCKLTYESPDGRCSECRRDYEEAEGTGA